MDVSTKTVGVGMVQFGAYDSCWPFHPIGFETYDLSPCYCLRSIKFLISKSLALKDMSVGLINTFTIHGLGKVGGSSNLKKS